MKTCPVTVTVSLNFYLKCEGSITRADDLYDIVFLG